jgi:hypothetical protein
MGADKAQRRMPSPDMDGRPTPTLRPPPGGVTATSLCRAYKAATFFNFWYAKQSGLCIALIVHSDRATKYHTARVSLNDTAPCHPNAMKEAKR